MFKNFVNWFVIFGLSFLVSNVFHWTEQGRAFLYIHLGVSIIFVVIFTLVLLIAGIAAREKLLTFGMSFLLVATIAVKIAIILLATWGATKIFKVDFFVTYQIMTFGACLVTQKIEKGKENKDSQINIRF